MMYDIHVTLDGTIIDLHNLSDEEYGFYSQCLSAYKSEMPRAEFLKMMQDPSNPMMKGNRFITKEIAQTDLFRAIQDLEERLAIAQGKMSPNPGDLVDEEPAQHDEFVTANVAAQKLGISAKAVTQAIQDRRLPAHREAKGDTRGFWKIPLRALTNYQPKR